MREVALTSYQLQALQFAIENKFCGLFLPMGSGKTIISLLCIDQLGEHPWLVIAPPMVAKYTWKDEVAKFNLPLRVVSLDGSPNERRKKLLTFEADIYTLSCYNVYAAYHEGLLKNFKSIIVDEISMFKDTTSDRHKALYKIRQGLNRLIGLTGTPCPNGIISIFGIIKIIDSDILGKFKSRFQNKYFTPKKFINNVVVEWEPKIDSQKDIEEAIKPVCLSIPSINLNCTLYTIDVYVEMNNVVKKLYNKLKKDFILNFGTLNITAPTAATLSMKFQQMANGRVYAETGESLFLHNEKVKMLRDILLQADDNALIVYNFKHDKDACLELKDVEEFDLERWNNREQKAALIHPMNVGHGLNLQFGGSIIIWFGMTWNLELYEQTVKRLFRRGQTKDVRIYRILTKKTIEDKMINKLKSKSNVQEALINSVMEEIGDEN